MKREGYRKLANLLAFDLAWPGCVLTAALGYPWVGPVLAAVLVPLHVATAPGGRRELMFVAQVALAGVVLDSVLGVAGFYDFRSEHWGLRICPPWLVALWLLFACTINGSLSLLASRRWLAAGAGAMGGAIGYVAGAKLGALGLAFSMPVSSLLIALIWALVLPAAFAYSRRLHLIDGPANGDRNCAASGASE